MNDPNPRYAALFENLIAPGCIIDLSGHVLAWNNAMSVLTQHSRRTALDTPITELGEVPTALYRHWKSTSQTGVYSQHNLQIHDQFFEVTCIPLPDKEWAIIAQEEIDTPTQNEVLYPILHDLKNPLAAIKGYAELISNIGEVTEKQGRYLERIDVAVEDIQELITSLLDVSWVDSGIALHLESVSLAHMVNDIAQRFVERAKQRDIDLILSIDRVPDVLCDQRRMKQVVNNLLNNAIKYTPDGQEVEVRVQQQNSHVCVAIRDNGIGIAPEFHQKIFQRFFRVPDSAVERIEGTGLGLAISYEILQRHGVPLKIDSAIGKGSTFYFSFPIKE